MDPIKWPGSKWKCLVVCPDNLLSLYMALDVSLKMVMYRCCKVYNLSCKINAIFPSFKNLTPKFLWIFLMCSIVSHTIHFL